MTPTPTMRRRSRLSNESRTQVAVNSEGKTNEATKNLKEPLRKGQTAPKDDNTAKAAGEASEEKQ